MGGDKDGEVGRGREVLYFEESCVPWKELGLCQGHEMTRSEPLSGHSSKRVEGGLLQGKKSTRTFG